MLFDIITKENVKYYKELVPEVYLNRMFMPGAVCIGAAMEQKDSNEFEAAGVLIMNVADKSCMRIEYLQVDPDYREQEIGTLLLRQAYDLAKQMEILNLIVKIPETNLKEGDGFNDSRAYFFLRRGFDMTEKVEREWWFSVKALENYKKLDMGKTESKFVPLSKLEPKVYRKVFESLEKEVNEFATPFMYDAIDKDLSYAYVENGNLKGYFITELFDDTYYPVAFVNLTDQATIALALLRKLLVCMAKDGNQSNNVHIILRNEAQRDAMELLIKEIPSVDMNILEARNDNMDAEEEHIQDLMDAEEFTKKRDEEFPKEFEVAEIEYYGGEIEKVLDY